MDAFDEGYRPAALCCNTRYLRYYFPQELVRQHEYQYRRIPAGGRDCGVSDDIGGKGEAGEVLHILVLRVYDVG